MIPVLVDGAAHLHLHQLPAYLAPLARRQSIRLDHESFTADTAKLLSVLERTLGSHVDLPGDELASVVQGFLGEGNTTAKATRIFNHSWAAGYEGFVWMHIRPTAADIDAIHHVSLKWGPWRQDLHCRLGGEGLVLLTEKAADNGSPPPLRLESDRLVFCQFGIGAEVVNAPSRDIRFGWEMA